MRNSGIMFLVCIALSAILISGCTSQQQPGGVNISSHAVTIHETLTNSPGGSTGLPNPASVYCIAKGGNLTIQKDSAGNEYGVCSFPNGSACEEWSLYRGECSLSSGTAGPVSGLPDAGSPGQNLIISPDSSSQEFPGDAAGNGSDEEFFLDDFGNVSDESMIIYDEGNISEENDTFCPTCAGNRTT